MEKRLDINGNLEVQFNVTKKDFLYDVPFEDKDVLEVIVRKQQRKRTNPMNRYMWGEVIPKVAFGLRAKGYRMNPLQVESVVIELMKTMTNDGAHAYLKNRFDKRVIVNEETGEVIEKKASTADMTTVEMKHYFEEIKQFAAQELEVEIQDPPDRAFDSLINENNQRR